MIWKVLINLENQRIDFLYVLVFFSWSVRKLPFEKQEFFHRKRKLPIQKIIFVYLKLFLTRMLPHAENFFLHGQFCSKARKKTVNKVSIYRVRAKTNILMRKYIYIYIYIYIHISYCLNPLSHGEGRCTPPPLPCFFDLYSKYHYSTHT